MTIMPVRIQDMTKPVRRPPTLRSVVVDSIREMILAGQVELGEALREMDLAKGLSVSRVTVREALRELQEERIIRIIPHRGAYVVELTQRLAKDLYGMLIDLETYAIKLAMSDEGVSIEDLEPLEKLAGPADELQQEEADSWESAESDIAFHKSLCRLGRNQLLIDLHSSLQSLRFLILRSYPVCRIRPYDVGNPPGHGEIVRALQSGNTEAAIQTLINHIGTYRDALIIRMERST
jgi:DNA-binding GntR family transcriptional regulator